MFDKTKLAEGFTTVPNQALIDRQLSHLEYRVYAGLLRFRNMNETRKTGRVGLTETGLADLVHASRARVSRSLRKLEEHGYIRIHKLDTWKGHDCRNTYELLDLKSMPIASVSNRHTDESQCAPSTSSVCPDSGQDRRVSVPGIDTRNSKEYEEITHERPCDYKGQRAVHAEGEGTPTGKVTITSHNGLVYQEVRLADGSTIDRVVRQDAPDYADLAAEANRQARAEYEREAELIRQGREALKASKGPLPLGQRCNS